MSLWSDVRRERIDEELNALRGAEWKEPVRYGGELLIHFNERHWLDVQRERRARLLGEPRRAA